MRQRHRVASRQDDPADHRRARDWKGDRQPAPMPSPVLPLTVTKYDRLPALGKARIVLFRPLLGLTRILSASDQFQRLFGPGVEHVVEVKLATRWKLGDRLIFLFETDGLTSQQRLEFINDALQLLGRI